MIDKEKNNWTSSLSAEMILLLDCSRSYLTEQQIRKISILLSRGLDWNAVVDIGIEHKVIPLLHRCLTTHFKKDIPESVLTWINALYKKNSFDTLLISASLIRIIRLLGENKIDVLPVKGAVLADKLYGSVSMRSYADIDILIKQQNIEKALDVLMAHEYKMLPRGIPRSTFLNFLKHYHHGRLLDKNGILVELHWELSGFYVPTPMTFDSLKLFMRKTTFNNCPTLELTDEMLFIFLCLHGNKHCFMKLDYVCSIAELIQAVPDLNWQIVINLGEKYRMLKRIAISLTLATSLYDIVLPAQIVGLLSNYSSTASWVEKILVSELSGTKEIDRIHPLKKQMRHQFCSMDSMLDAIKFIMHYVFTPTHDIWGIHRLPDFLFPYYFFYKPYRTLTNPIRKKIFSDSE